MATVVKMGDFGEIAQNSLVGSLFEYNIDTNERRFGIITDNPESRFVLFDNGQTLSEDEIEFNELKILENGVQITLQQDMKIRG